MTDLSVPELERFRLGVITRAMYPHAFTRRPVVRVYCLRCGTQIDHEKKDAEPNHWWRCPRRCNADLSS
jgi:hypothetical protein